MCSRRISESPKGIFGKVAWVGRIDGKKSFDRVHWTLGLDVNEYSFFACILDAMQNAHVAC